MKRKIQRLEMTEGNYAACVSDPPTKTQTRRRMRDQPPPETHRMDPEPFGLFGAYERSGIRIPGTYKPRLRVGDFAALTLPHWRWVGFGTLHIWDQITGLERIEGEGVVAEHALPPNVAFKRKAARYMPVWACPDRIEIVGVRAERLGEITWNDAIEEGCYVSGHMDPDYLWRWPGQPREADGYASPLEAYAREWEALHGAGAWDPDEWVWVRDFKLLEGKP